MAHRFALVRRIVVFVLGTWIIVDAINDNASSVPKLVIGMIMVGVLPIENFALWRPIEKPHKESIDQPCKREIES